MYIYLILIKQLGYLMNCTKATDARTLLKDVHEPSRKVSLYKKLLWQSCSLVYPKIMRTLSSPWKLVISCPPWSG